ncbi:MAG: glucose-1-phosphate adenylyltransferase [candidate division WOR-3 bacterium]|nr:MAG: glucose-1-phosphate adenylyltransferase [candidate division WOR-3 bacterium]
MKKEIVAMLLAGGTGSRLNILVDKRAKPALPFGAIYRIIDFTLSNIVNSSIDVVGILTQYKPLSLMEHVDGGRPWDLFGRTRLVEILPPKTGEEMSDWYKGTSDAIYQNMGFVEDFAPELVLVVSGDHIYSMDYKNVINFHREKNADATVCLIKVAPKDVHHFGIVGIDRNGRIDNWIEKPKTATSNLASMGIYVFNRKPLMETLTIAARTGGYDFARDIIPRMLQRKRVFGFMFEGYWRDVGTIHAYWQTNLDMLQPRSGLAIRDWKIKTNLSVKGEIGDRPSAYIRSGAVVENSLIARGCVIEGEVTNSVLSPGVKIGQGSRIANSIIYHDSVIGSRSTIEKCIIDKQVVVGNSVRMGTGKDITNRKHPGHLSSGITVIGKGAMIPSGMNIGKNCIISTGAQLSSRGRMHIRSGSTV